MTTGGFSVLSKRVMLQLRRWCQDLGRDAPLLAMDIPPRRLLKWIVPATFVKGRHLVRISYSRRYVLRR